jgi:hypothetical protein
MKRSPRIRCQSVDPLIIVSPVHATPKPSRQPPPYRVIGVNEAVDGEDDVDDWDEAEWDDEPDEGSMIPAMYRTPLIDRYDRECERAGR